MITLIRLWGHTQRKEGYEIRADFQDENGNILNECFMFTEKPTDIEINLAVESVINRYTQQPKYQYEIINEDGTVTYA